MKEERCEVPTTGHVSYQNRSHLTAEEEMIRNSISLTLNFELSVSPTLNFELSVYFELSVSPTLNFELSVSPNLNFELSVSQEPSVSPTLNML